MPRPERDYAFEALGTAAAGEAQAAQVRRHWRALRAFLRDYGYDEMYHRVEWLESQVQARGK